MKRVRRAGKAFVTSALGALVLVSLGCAEYYRAETILHPDGSVERAVYAMDAEALDESRWQHVRKVDEQDFSKWRGSIRDIPERAKDDNDSRAAITAWGKFDSVDQVPESYSLEHDTSRAARFERLYTTNDLVFVTEHSWKEVLTDIFELSDARRAARELPHLLAEFGSAVLTERLGAEYDSSLLVQWADTEGAIWLNELLDALVDSAMRSEDLREQIFYRRFAEICAAHGLVLKDGQGRSPGDEDFQEDEHLKNAIREFVETKLHELIRRRDGRPVEDQVIAEITDDWFDSEKAQDGEHREQEKPSELEKSVQRVIAQQYGGKNAFEERLQKLIQRLVGVHVANLSSQYFHYSMEMPGVVIATNGRLETDQRVVWQFEADDAFPYGYTMSCQSLAANEEVQRQVLGKSSLTERAELLEYFDLVRGREDLLAILRQCRQQNRLQPLLAYRRQLLDSGQTDGVQRVERLAALLLEGRQPKP